MFKVSMNVEGTLEALLQSHRRAMQRADRADERMDRAEQRANQRADRADRRMDQFDKKLDVTRRLVQQGMKIVIDLGKSKKELDFKLNALIDAQSRLAAMLMRKNTNGRR